MSKNLKCLPNLNNILLSVYLKIKNTPEGTGIEDFVSSISTLIKDKEPVFFDYINDPLYQEDFNNYIQDLSATLGIFSRKMKIGKDKSKFYPLLNTVSDTDLESKLATSLMNAAPSFNAEVESIVLDTAPAIEETIVPESMDKEMSDGDASNTVKDIADDEFIGELQVGEDKFLQSFINKYFRNISALTPEFKRFVIESFYKSNISLKHGDAFFLSDISDIRNNMKENLEAKLVDYNPPANLKDLLISDDFGSTSKQKRDLYYNYILNKYFDKVIGNYITGINWKTLSYESTATGKENYEEVNSHNPLEGVDDYIKMLLNTTPKVRMTSKGLEFITDANNNNVYINEKEIISVYDELAHLENHLGKEAFERSFQERMLGNDLLTTLYYRFFSSDSHIINGESYHSFSSLADIIEYSPDYTQEHTQRLKNIVINLRTNLTTSTASKHIINKNNKVILSDVINLQAIETMKSELNNITEANIIDNLSGLKNIVLVEEGKLKITIGTDSIIYDIEKSNLNGSKGFFLSIDRKETLKNTDLNNETVALKVLNKLFPGTIIANRDFVKNYKINASKSGSNVDVSLANLIGNLAYAYINNHTISKNSLEDFGFGIQLAEDKTTDLKYPIYDSLFAFADTLSKTAEDTRGSNSKLHRTNSNGDKVALSSLRSAMDNLKTRTIPRIRATPNSVNRLNALVNGSAGKGPDFTIDGYVSKDGVTKMGETVSNAEMNITAQHTYLMEDAFLQVAKSFNFRKAGLQVLVPSDRSDVRLPIIQNNNGEYLPLTKTGKLDIKNLKSKYITVRKNYHNSLAEKIIERWTKHLLGSGRIDGTKVFNNLSELQDFIIKSEIPLEEAERSNILTKELMYVSEEINKVKYARIKDAIIISQNIWNNEQLANARVDRMYSVYLETLREDGYYVKPGVVMADGSKSERLGYEATKIMQARFGGITDNWQLKKILAQAYFYHQGIIAHEFNNLNGSLYQYPGANSKNKKITLSLNKEAYLTQLKKQDKTKGIKITDLRLSELNKIAEGLISQDQLDLDMSGMWLNRTKREAINTSTNKKPTLVAENETGFLLDTHSNIAICKDKEVVLKLLNSLNSNEVKQEAYNAVFFALPLFRSKINNSLGGELDVLYNSGAPIKNLTVSHDIELGTVGQEKKVTFIIPAEMLKEGSPELHRLVRKMMNTIKFEDNLLLGKFSSLYELFLDLKGFDNSKIWEQIENILAANPYHRNKYIELFGMDTAAKAYTGSINDSSVYTDDDVPMLHYSRDNFNEGIILNLEHNFDTTGEDKSEMSFMTQMQAALVFEGTTFDDALKVNNAMQNLSNFNLDIIKDSIVDRSIEMLYNITNIDTTVEGLTDEEFMQVKAAFKEYSPENVIFLKDTAVKLNLIEKARKAYAQDLAKTALKSRELSGAATSLINAENPSLSSPQLRHLLHSAVMAELNSVAVRVKFPGVQCVLAPSYEFIKLYSTAGSNKMLRSEYTDYCVKNNLLRNITTLEQLKELTPSDTVLLNGTILKYYQIMHLEELPAILAEGTLQSADYSQTYELNWTQYIRYEEGKTIRLEDEPEYIAFHNAGDAITKEQLNSLKNALKEKLKLYNTKDVKSAEFLMPMLHMNNFGLEDNDKLVDIIGHSDNKNDKIVSANEFFKKRIWEKRNSIKFSGKKPFFRHYRLISNKLDSNTLTKLEDRFNEINDKINSDIKNIQTPYLIAQNSVLTKFFNDNSTLINSIKENPALMLDNNGAFTAKLAEVVENLNSLNTQSMKSLIDTIASKQAASFVKSLEFIVGRIPGQGKQSFTAGEIKGFLNSTMNSIYSPKEMYTITGADHDGDKGNVLAYSINEFGDLYTYDYLLDGSGNINQDKIKDILKTKKDEYNKYFNKQGLKREDVLKKVNNLLAKEKENIENGIKNYVLDKLISIIKDPNNALEASVAISMDQLKSILERGGKVIVVDHEDETQNAGTLMSTSSKMNPDNPAALPNLEIINSTGKSQVGIFATAIKAYASIFTACLNTGAEENSFIKFGKTDFAKLFENNNAAQQLFMELFKGESFVNEEGDNKMHIFIDDSKGGLIHRTSSNIANTLRFDSVSQEAKLKAEVRKKKLLNEGLSEKAYNDLLLNEAKTALSNELMNEEQTWEYLSELLSAATDNAKEFILGQIGANDYTSGTIVSLLISGFSLKDTLTLMKNEDIKQVVRKLEQVKNPYDRSDKFQKDLLAIIQKDLKDKYGESFEKLNTILNDVKETYNSKKKQFERLEASVMPSTDLTSTNQVSFVKSNEENNEVSLSNLSNMDIPSEDKIQEKFIDVLEKVKSNIINLADLMKDKYKIIDHINILEQSDLVLINVNDLDLTHSSKILLDDYARKVLNKEIYAITSNGLKQWYNGELKDITNLPLLKSKVGIIGKIDPSRLNKTIDSLKENTLEYIVDNENWLKNYNLNREELFSTLKNELESAELKLKNVLVYGPLQLLPFVKGAFELRAISSILSINQGLKNDAFSSYKYFSTFSKMLNKVLPEDTPKYSVTQVKEFFDSLINDTNKEKALEEIKKYEQFKTLINPFYVISKNPHYLGYINALITGKQVLTSGTPSLDVVNNLAEELGISEENKYRKLTKFVDSFVTDKFLSKDKYNSVIFHNTSYDLSDAEGRNKFVNDFPGIVISYYKTNKKFEGNEFIQSLNIDNDIDFAYQLKHNYLKPYNSLVMSADKKASYELAMNELNDASSDSYEPELYNALLFYSVITSKGAAGQNSFINLFSDSTLPAYEAFLQEFNAVNPTELEAEIKDYYKEAPLLIDYDFVVDRSTMYSFKQNEDLDADEVAKSNNITRNDYFNFGHLVDKSGEPKITLFKSSQTGIVYSWSQEYKTFVPLVPMFNNKAINISKDVIGIEKFGYQEGYNAVIDNDGNIGRVLFYDSKIKSYKVLTSNNEVRNANPEFLKNLNPDMVFIKNNFGKISKEEKADPNFVGFETEEDKENKTIRLTKSEKSRIVKRGSFRKVISNAPEGIVPGEEFGETILQDGTKLTFKYIGVKKIDDRILNSLSYYDQKFKGNHHHLVEIINRTPKVKDFGATVSLQSGSTFIGGSEAHNKVYDGRAVAFTLPIENNTLEVGKEIILKFNGAKGIKYFKVTNQGLFKSIADKEDRNSLQKKLGFTGERSAQSFDKINQEQRNYYTAVPMHDEVYEINSTKEGNLLPDIDNINLDTLQLITVNDDLDNELKPANKILKSFGITQLEKPSDVLTSELEQTKKQVTELKNSLGIYSMPTNLNKIVNAIDSASAVFVYTELKPLSDKHKEIAGFTKVDKPTKQINNFLVSSFDDEVSIEDRISTIRDWLIDIETGNPVENKVLKQIGTTNGQKSLLVDASKYLRSAIKSDIPVELLTNSEIHFEQIHLAKKLGKDLFVYNTTVDQWLKYDHENGTFKEVKIPVIPNKSAIFNYEQEANKEEDISNVKPFTNLLKRTNIFEDINNADLGSMNYISELYFATLVPNEEINKTIETGLEALQQFKNFENKELFQKKVDAQIVTFLKTADEELIKTNNSKIIKLPNDTEFSLLSDGSLEIKFKDKYGVLKHHYAISDILTDKYQNFRGKKDSKNPIYSVEIDGEAKYFSLPLVHESEPEVFSTRDQLLEEKAQLKEKYKVVNDFYQNEVIKLYKQLRHGKGFLRSQVFANYKGYNQFMLYLKNGVMDLLPDEQILADRLLDSSLVLKQLQKEAQNYLISVNKKYQLKDIKVNLHTGEIDRKANDVRVSITTNQRKTTKFDTSEDLSDKQFKNLFYKRDAKGQPSNIVEGYVLPLYSVYGDDYKKIGLKFLEQSFGKLVDAANKNPGQNFIVDLSDNLNDDIFPGVKGSDIAGIFANLINRFAVEGLPTNLKFKENLGKLINEFEGTLSPSLINRIEPFRVTGDSTTKYYNVSSILKSEFSPGSGINIGQMWNKWRDLAMDVEDINLESSAVAGSEVMSKFSGDLRSAFKALMKEWATINPKAFRTLAMKIGSKAIYDRNYSDGDNLTVGETLAELLTEKYVHNSWLEYPINSFDINMDEDQRIIPISNEQYNSLEFTKKSNGGRAILKIGDKNYIATIENNNNKPIKSDSSLSASLADDLGIDMESESINSDIITKYPVVAGKFITLRLEELDSLDYSKEKFEKGQVSELLKAAKFEYKTAEHEKLASKATVVWAIDHTLNFTDNKFIHGVDWMNDLKQAIGNKVMIDINEGDSIWITGSMLSDVKRLDQVKNAFLSVKSLVDKACQVGAELLIGTSYGIEEEVRSYVLSRYPEYQITEDGLKKGAYESPKTKAIILQVAPSKSGITRFNANNNSNREGNQNGPFGTKLFSKLESQTSVSVANVFLDEKTQIVNWDNNVSADHLSKIPDLIRSLVETTETPTEYTKIRRELIIKEQLFIEKLLKLHIISSFGLSDIAISSTTEEAFKLATENQDIQDAYNLLFEKVFNKDFTLKGLSDLALMSMSRNRSVTLNYIKDLIPEVYETIGKEREIFNTLMSDRRRFEKEDLYKKEILNSDELSIQDLAVVDQSVEKGTTTYRDLYYFLTTLGSSKIFTKYGLDGTMVSELFNKVLGVKAIKNNEGEYTILDNDSIRMVRNKNSIIDSKLTSEVKEVKEANEDFDYLFAKKRATAFYYLRKNGLQYDRNTGRIRFNIGKANYKFTIKEESKVKDSYKIMGMIMNVYNEHVLENLYKPFEFIPELQFSNGLYLNIKNNYKNELNKIPGNQYYSNSELNFNNWYNIFHKKTKDYIDNDLLVAGELYAMANGDNYFCLEGKDKAKFLVKSDGSVFKAEGNDLVNIAKVDLYVNKYNVIDSIAPLDRSALGKRYTKLDTGAGSAIESGKSEDNSYTSAFYIESSGDEIIAIEKSISNPEIEYRTFKLDISKGFRKWVYISQPIKANALGLNMDIYEGAKVLSLPIHGIGISHLKNGKAISTDKVVDDLGTYTKNSDGNWIPEWKGGFSGSIKFQKSKIEAVNEGSKLSSKVVSPRVLRKLVDKFKQQGLNIELMTNEDIRTVYGEEYSNKSGMTIDEKVIINSDIATLDTPMHEYAGHIFLEHLKATDRKAYNKVIEMSLNQPIRQQLEKSYKGLTEEELGNEIFSTLIGLESQSKLDKVSMSLFQKVKKTYEKSTSILDFFKKFFNLVFGNTSELKINLNDSLFDIMDQVSDAILFGDESVLKDMNSFVKNHFENARKKMKSEEELIKDLQEVQLIRKTCI